jgi:methionyl-tRNA formyltransferase
VRTVFLGTSEFGAVILRRLASSPDRPELVVTRPDRPRGRGRKLAAPPVAELARELRIELDQPESVNTEAAQQRIADARPEVVLVCAFGALIKEPLLSRYPMLNLHPSLLPRWRGAAPIERAIMAGDGQTGVSIMRLTAGLDSGPVCAQRRETIGPQDTYGVLADRLARTGAELLVSTLREWPPCREQDEALVTYAEKITPRDRELDSGRPALELDRVVRALAPHIGAFVLLDDGTRLGVHEARVGPAQPAQPAQPARLGIRLAPPLPVLDTIDGTLELLVVQPPGGRPMPGEDYLRGRQT